MEGAEAEGVEAIPEEEEGEDDDGGEEKKAAAEGRLARVVDEPVAVAEVEVEVDGPPLPSPEAAGSPPKPLAALAEVAARSAAAVSAASALAFSDVKLMPAKRDMASASVGGRMDGWMLTLIEVRFNFRIRCRHFVPPLPDRLDLSSVHQLNHSLTSIM